MLRSLKDLEHYSLVATDGETGTVVDFLLDDELWTIRYLVAAANVATGARDVLIPPISFRAADRVTRRFRLALTRDKVRASPGIDTNQPVSRQHEIEHHRYFGYPRYWGGFGVWGLGANPAVHADGRRDGVPAVLAGVDGGRGGDRHLRSASEARGYHVEGLDESIGRIADFIVDDATWEVRYLVVDTGSWSFGRKVLVEPRWALRVSWAEGRIYFGLSRQAIRNSPTWDGTDAVDRRYEVQLHDYYGRPAYWRQGDRLAEAGPPLRAGRGHA
jgi:hypothetical protein